MAGRSPLAALPEAATFTLVALLLCVVAYWPFFAWLHSQVGGLGLVTVRTQWQHLLIVWAPLLVLALALPLAAGRVGWSANGLWFWPAGVLALVALALAGFSSLAVLLALVSLTIYALWRVLPHGKGGEAGGTSEEVYALLLVLLAGLLLAACEVVYVRDGFGNRMNTVFKLYYQAWAVLAVAGAYTLYYVNLRRRTVGWQGGRLFAYRGWLGLSGLVLASGLLYTGVAPLSKAAGFAGVPTLDGLAWLERSNPQEREAIAWLQGLEGSPVILEASGGEYGDGNQGSAFSGLPTLLGWSGHEYQWRGATAEPARRKADIDRIYQTGDTALAERLLRQYGVTYVYVGAAERQAYAGVPASSLTKFGRFMDVAFQNQGVTIYRLRSAPL